MINAAWTRRLNIEIRFRPTTSPHNAMPLPLEPVALEGPSRIERVDPRARLVAAVVFSIVVAMADRFVVLGTALAVVLLGVAICGLSLRVVIRRLAPLNGLLAVLIFLLPLSMPGAPWRTVGPLDFTREGLLLGFAIGLKANAIVLTLLVLLGSIDPITLGHTLSHLRVHDKLAHLLLFTVRYLDVLQRETRRLRAAMKMRAFRPRIDRRTYRAYGYLIGMLLVRSLDRSERVVAAMKCRGFCGRFYLLDHFAFSRRDVPFCIASCVVILTLLLLQWL